MFLKIKLLFLLTFFIYLTTCEFSSYTDDSTNNYTHTVQEIQHAVCKIATEDIQASANASITRQLKGVCTSKEMNNRLDLLEKLILNELILIKQALHIENQSPNQLKSKDLETEAPTYSDDDYDYLNMIESVEIDKQINPQINSYRTLKTTENNTVDLPINVEALATSTTATTEDKKTMDASTMNITKDATVSYKRDLEAAKNNITIQNTELGASFLYFWKIYDIEEILTYSDTHIASPIFYLSGHQLQVKLYPHHLGSNYMTLELTSNKDFVPKHRFVVLNQNELERDLSSQILGTNAAMFRISTNKLSNGGFIINSSLLVKVIIVLHS